MNQCCYIIYSGSNFMFLITALVLVLVLVVVLALVPVRFIAFPSLFIINMIHSCEVVSDCNRIQLINLNDLSQNFIPQFHIWIIAFCKWVKSQTKSAEIHVVTSSRELVQILLMTSSLSPLLELCWRHHVSWFKQKKSWNEMDDVITSTGCFIDIAVEWGRF